MAEDLTNRMLNPHKKVHIAICSASVVFVEATGDLMSPFLKPVYQVLMQALQEYRTWSRLVLSDMLGVMAEYMGLEIGRDPLPGIYVLPLLLLLNNIMMEYPFDRSLLPLMNVWAVVP